MSSTPEEAITCTQEEGVKSIDVRSCDPPGIMQHFSIPVDASRDDAFTEGLMFGGSLIRGFQAVHESDMKLVPDVISACADPLRIEKTLAMNFPIVDPFMGEPYPRDPRNVARRAEEYLYSTGTTDTVYFGVEAEFYVFDNIRFDLQANSSSYAIDSEAGRQNTGRDEVGANLGCKMQLKGSYFLVSPNDHFCDLRNVVSIRLADAGLEVERAHHEVSTGEQQEINYTFSALLAAADDLMKFKYIIKNTVFEYGKSAAFMPKPLFGDNDSGMHCHQSLWKNGVPLFVDERGYGGLSDMTRWYTGGLLEHAPPLLAFTNPSVNSSHRPVSGLEAPVNLVYLARNRSACIRTPVAGSPVKAKKVEYRVLDPSVNPYLIFAAQSMMDLDGIRNRTEPAEPIDKDFYEFPPEEHALVDQLPESLEGVFRALEADHDYLLEGGVFAEDLIRTWIDYKAVNEIAPVHQRPRPYELALYYDIQERSALLGGRLKCRTRRTARRSSDNSVTRRCRVPGPAGGGELIGFLRAASSVRPGPAGRVDVAAVSSVQTPRQMVGSGTVRRTIALVNDIMVVNDIVLVSDQAPRFQQSPPGTSLTLRPEKASGVHESPSPNQEKYPDRMRNGLRSIKSIQNP